MDPVYPHNPYQHYRKISPTSYEDIIDPYRRHKSQPSDTTVSDQDNIHSRTVSDTSTSRLAVNGVSGLQQFHPSSTELDDDPFAISRTMNRTSTEKTDRNALNHQIIPPMKPFDSYQRANSYLPYSHHQRNPAQSITPIYIEDDKQNTMQGVGSMLQENFSVDMVQNEPRRRTEGNSLNQYSDKDEMEAHRNNQLGRRRRYLGLTIRKWLILLVTFLVIFILLMYFLIPRMPTVSFSSADTTQDQTWSPDKTALTTQWYISMALDNPNWIPTRLQNMVVSIEDSDTHQKIGSGMASPQWLSPRKKEQLIKLPVNIAYSSGVNTTDETIIDLFSVCGPQRQSLGPALVQMELFNITLQIDLSVQGVPWSTHTTLVPNHGIQCPD